MTQPKEICHTLEVFQNKCLRRILHIFWPNKITNAELLERTGMLPISIEVKKRRWRWIGHVNRMPHTSIPRVAIRWTPAGNRRRGRPKQTWKKFCGARDEGSWVELGPGRKAGSRQNTMAFLSVGLMCEHTRSK